MKLSGYRSLPTTLKTEALALELANATAKSFSLACPSPGEAASVPRLGHEAHFYSRLVMYSLTLCIPFKMAVNICQR